MVRAGLDVRNSRQLRDARHVPAVRRRTVHVHQVSRPRDVRPRHIRLLRRRDGRQGRRHGTPGQAGLPRRRLEQTRYVHRRRWV